jgi:hypothetical protein
MENTIVSKLMGMTVDEQLAFIDQLNDSSQSESIESSIKPYMTDDDLFDYLVKQDRGIMTMDEFEYLGKKVINELFIK